MPQTLQTLLDAPIIELDTIDSTNNYAMRLIDADTAQAGLTIVAGSQTAGKGQRGNSWKDDQGESLLMSIITVPPYPLDQQFLFNAAVTVAIADTLAPLTEQWDVRIKWPNDIIINDKKAGGVLIENVLRGNTWSFSIVGLGLNIAQLGFPAGLPFATSLNLASGKRFTPADLGPRLRHAILEKTHIAPDEASVMDDYNSYLYRRGCEQKFSNGENEWPAIINYAAADGKLLVTEAGGSLIPYNHGNQTWIWE